MRVTLQSRLDLVELGIRPDRGVYIVEDIAGGEYYEMTEASVAALNEIRSGNALERIQQELQTRYPDEDIQIVAFVEQLLELGLVANLDGVELGHASHPDGGGRGASNRRREFNWITPAWGRLFFNRVTYLIYGAIVLCNVLLLLLQPRLVPHYRDVFVFESMVANSLSWLSISLVIVLVHEFGHIMAARSFDLPARLGIGQRFIFVVFETEMKDIWRLQPNQRNAAYFAGICFDQTLLLACFSVQLLLPDHALVSKLAAFAALDICIKFVYQLCLFMKTDFYYVLENSTGCYNLMERSRAWLGKKVFSRGSTENRGTDPVLPSDVTTDREQRTVRTYAFVYLAGYALNIGIALAFFAPQLAVSVSTSWAKLSSPSGEALFWDAVVFFCELLLMAGLLLYALAKRWKESRTSRA